MGECDRSSCQIPEMLSIRKGTEEAGGVKKERNSIFADLEMHIIHNPHLPLPPYHQTTRASLKVLSRPYLYHDQHSQRPRLFLGGEVNSF